MSLLPECAWPYEPTPDGPEVGPLPMLSAGHVTFGCLNKAVKIAMQSIRVRFWRSMITAAGVFLGIAFLASTLANSTIGAHTKQDNTGLDPAQQSQIVQGQHDRQIWLVTLSLVVCTVGIANSMLMSVTERFKEIGTMKCLGAMDGFIVKLFLLEAGFLGILASVLGWVVREGSDS